MMKNQVFIMDGKNMLTRRIFDITKRDKTQIVRKCSKCVNYSIIEKDWERFITKFGLEITCVDHLFPEWRHLRSPHRKKKNV